MSAQRRVWQATGVVAAAFLLSRVMGLIRDVVISYYYGASTLEVIAYTYANRIPELIFNVTVGGALGSAFIPTFAGYLARDDEAGAWRLFSAVLHLVLIVTVLLAGVAALLAPQIMAGFISAEHIDQHAELPALATRLMRLMLWTPIIFGASGVLMGALNARQHFLTPALAASLYNLGIIAGTVFWAPDATGLAIGTVLGAVGHLSIQLPALRRQGARYAAVLTLRDAGVQQVLKLMGPRVLGLSFSYLNPIVIAFLTRPLLPASIVALERAFRITLMPYSILGQAMGVAAFPTLATLAAEARWREMQQLIATSLRSILFLGLPIAAGLMVLRRPLVSLIFERGEFSAQDTALVSWALLFYALALVALAMLEVVARAFYALGDTATPVVAGMVQLPLMALLGAWLAYVVFPAWQWLALGGLALGYSVSNVMEVGVLLWLLRRKLGGLNGRDLLDGAWRMGAAVFLMVAVLGVALRPLAATSVVWQLLVGGVVGAAVYGLGCWLGRVREFGQLLRYGQRIVQRVLK